MGGGDVRRASRRGEPRRDRRRQRPAGARLHARRARPVAARRPLVRVRLGRPRGRRPRRTRELAATIAGLDTSRGRPHVLLAKTTFGYGVDFMESQIEWHYMPMDDDQYASAIAQVASAVRNAFLDELLSARRAATSGSCCSPATSASWCSSRSPSASRTASSTSASPSRTWSAIATGLAEAGYRGRSSTRSRRSRSMRPLRVHPQRPGAARPAGADRRHRRRLRLRPTTASRTTRSRTSRSCAPSRGMTVIAPGRPATRRAAALRQAHDARRARLLPARPRAAQALPGLHGRFELGRAETADRRRSDDVALLAYGPIAAEALAAARRLRAPRHRPRPSSSARASRRRRSPTSPSCSAASTPRSPSSPHYVNGGLGSLVCEVVAEHGLGTRVIRCAVRTMPSGATGSQAPSDAQHGLTCAAGRCRGRQRAPARAGSPSWRESARHRRGRLRWREPRPSAAGRRPRGDRLGPPRQRRLAPGRLAGDLESAGRPAGPGGLPGGVARVRPGLGLPPRRARRLLVAGRPRADHADQPRRDGRACSTACRARGFHGFVHAGSSSEYGFQDHAPREDELVAPNSDYATMKAAATLHCRSVARRDDAARRDAAAVLGLRPMGGAGPSHAHARSARVRRGAAAARGARDAARLRVQRRDVTRAFLACRAARRPRARRRSSTSAVACRRRCGRSSRSLASSSGSLPSRAGAPTSRGRGTRPPGSRIRSRARDQLGWTATDDLDAGFAALAGWLRERTDLWPRYGIGVAA